MRKKMFLLRSVLVLLAFNQAGNAIPNIVPSDCISGDILSTQGDSALGQINFSI